MQADFGTYLPVAVRCARSAGEWIRSRFGKSHDTQVKTGPRDLVTDVDRSAETMIRRLLKLYVPDHTVLGEEGIPPEANAYEQAIRRAQAAPYVWIVDPIDGTTNYVHGFPYFSVSIALACKGDVMAGVVYDPLKDEMFAAEKGKGAFLDGRPLAVSEHSQLEESLVAGGWDVDSAFEANRRSLARVMPIVRNVRIGGSAALHLAYVAAGRLTGCWEYGLQAWDIAAGALLVQEAGGIVTDTRGLPYRLDTRHVAASNRRIHEPLLATIGE